MPNTTRAQTIAMFGLASMLLLSFDFFDEWEWEFFRHENQEGYHVALNIWRASTMVGESGWMLAACALAAVLAAWTGSGGAGQNLRDRMERLRDQALFVMACVSGIGVLAIILKFSIGRARPKMHDAMGVAHFDPFALNYKINSFPSGHAATLFALAAALALLAPRWRALLYAVAAAGALSRLAAGQHYLSDVIAGAALGHFGARGMARAAAARGRVFDADLTPLDAHDTATAGRDIVHAMRDQGSRWLGHTRR